MRFDEALIAAWCRHPAVATRVAELAEGYEGWKAHQGTPTGCISPVRPIM